MKEAPILATRLLKRLRWTLLLVAASSGCLPMGSGGPGSASTAPGRVVPRPTAERIISSPPPPTMSQESSAVQSSPSPARTPSPHLPTATVRSSTSEPTSFPTLDPDELNRRVLNLLRTNAGCQLPCWWGVVPAETSWTETRQVLGSLGLTAERYSDPHVTNYSTWMHLPQSDISIAQMHYIDDSSTIWLIWVGSVTVQDNEWVYGNPGFVNAWQGYTPESLVAAYGEPSQVLIHIVENTADGLMIPFQVLLHYADQGVLVRYYGPAELLGDQLRVCLVGAHVELWLWSADSPLTLEELAEIGPNLPPEFLHGYVPFEQALDQSFGDFAAKTGNSGACFESPADRWP